MNTIAPDPAEGRGGAEAQAPSRQARSLASQPALADLAAQLLSTSGAFADLGSDEAACVAGYMGLVAYPAGAVVLREGDSTNTSYMLLILHGEVTVEASDPGTEGEVPISVLGPGNMIGEMGLIDGSARSATCRAATALQAAGLTRKALQQLLDEQPKVGAKLMIGLCKRLADRLRALNEQLLIYSRLNAALRQQFERARPRG